MKKMHKKNNLLKLLICFPLPFLISACMTHIRPVQDKDNWQLFTEVKNGQYQLLIDTAHLSPLNDGYGSLKGKAKVVPSPKKIKALKDAITEANREAGIEAENEKQMVEGIVKGETTFHDCEIACKKDMFYFYIHKQHILEFQVSESGPDRDLVKSVCEGFGASDKR